MMSLSLREGPQFKTAFLLTQKTWENAVNFPSVVHLGFCYAKSKKLMKVWVGPFVYDFSIILFPLKIIKK